MFARPSSGVSNYFERRKELKIFGDHDDEIIGERQGKTGNIAAGTFLKLLSLLQPVFRESVGR